MELATASALISFYSQLEDAITHFYQTLATRHKFSEGHETFLVLAQENQKHKKMILRTYREVISDALETSFSFVGVNTEDYNIDTDLAPNMSFTAALLKAEAIEALSSKFCMIAGQQSRSLLASLPQAFEHIAKKKTHRKQVLQALRE